MFAEEETELRDLIIQNLENCGFLNKIKAEIRAGVFLALEEEGSLNKIPLINKTFHDFCDTSEGKLALSIVREFLDHFKLNFTLSVFDPEVAGPTPYFSRTELCDELKLSVAENESVISSLLKNRKSLGSEKANTSPFISNPNPDVTKISSLSEPVDNIKDTFVSKLCSGNFPKKETISFSDDIESEHKLSGNKHFVKDSINEKSVELDTKETFEVKSTSSKTESVSFEKKNLDIFGTGKSSSIFKDSKDGSALDHDSFFDEPLPTVKPSYFSYHSENITGMNLKDSSPSNSSGIKNDSLTADKNSLTSLKDLPSLTSKEWTFSRDPKSALPSLDSLKSVSSSENSNEEIINLDQRDILGKKDVDATESNEDLSEKQINSEESIEEEIEEDFSAGIDDLLNSSMSLADDATTDQTVSQVSIIEGVDHVEPCNTVK